MRFPWSRGSGRLEDVIAALNRSQAVIEFEPSGRILNANKLFLEAMGYSLSEIQGHHHSMFVEGSYAASEAYRSFWKDLAQGSFKSGKFKRFGKGGNEIWIEASYNPIFGKDGKPYKVIKFATDVTGQVREAADMKGQVEAINRVSAVITFDLDGNILDANPNFLAAMEYRLDEVQGRHHSMFATPEYARSDEYKEFWASLKAGKASQGKYRRLGKGGKEIWIQASYNPILTPEGVPYKVVKFATDITDQVQLLKDLERIIDVNFAEIDRALSQSQHRTDDAVHATSETTDNVQTLAASAEEMAASIAEISSTMSRSREATFGATESTVAAANATERLTGATQSMSGIVKLIQDIAGEINLLALNATIESARAGEAGRGFAVVANEVKKLAEQASRATEQISAEIDGMQAISDDVVEALQTINHAFETVKEQVSTAAAAVEEQTVVTSGMSHNMQQAADAVRTISNSVNGIDGSVGEIREAVAKTREAALVLAS